MVNKTPKQMMFRYAVWVVFWLGFTGGENWYIHPLYRIHPAALLVWNFLVFVAVYSSTLIAYMLGWFSGEPGLWRRMRNTWGSRAELARLKRIGDENDAKLAELEKFIDDHLRDAK